MNDIANAAAPDMPRGRLSDLRAISIIVFLNLFAVACVGQGLVSDRQIARDRVEVYLSAHPATDKETVMAMRRFELRAGMSKQEVAATWRRPVEIQKWRSGTVDLWYFGCAWPNRCEAPDRGGILEDPIRADAFFRNDRLYRWSSP